jgi:ABC-type lipoprotein release transport system permease subunit
MRTYLKIAWRNLWRNKRRTILTIASVAFALFVALIMRSMQLASYDMMIESAVKSSTGYIQLHQKGYWDDKSINNTMQTSKDLEEAIMNSPHVTQVVPRLESFALASFGEQTKGIAFIGTDVGKEDQVSGLTNKVIQGRYMTNEENGVMVAEKLASYLKLNLGDSLVLLSQGYHGVTASGLYPVIAILKFVTPDMNNSLIYTNLRTSQEFYSVSGRITSLSVLIDNEDNLKTVVENIQPYANQELEVMTWKVMLKELLQGIQGDNVSGLFMLGILYLVVGFGIFGTILMMTMELRKEFGIMVALGMQRIRLSWIVFYETVIIGIIGIIVGIVTSLPVILYLFYHPIRLKEEAAQAMLEYNMDPVIPVLIEPGYFVNQSIVVIVITLMAFVYPMVMISRFELIPAMRK